MAKKQSRRSVSLSRTTYERLKTYCETSGLSMSQFVETRIGDFLGSRPAIQSTTAPVASKPVRSTAVDTVTDERPSAGRPVGGGIFTF